MGKKIRIIIAVVLIIGAIYWAFNLIRERSYSGANLSVRVGSGSVLVTNRGQEPIPIEMRAEGRTASFRIESTDLDLSETSKSQRNGRSTYHAVSFELPPGQARINVARGSNVYLVSSSNQRIDAIVTPMRIDRARTTLVWMGLFILAVLYYISRTLEHRWIGVLRSRLPERIPGSTRTAA